MPTPSKNQVYLYNTPEEIKTSVPYTTEDTTELELVISCFVSWAQMVATHIQLATDLRTALKVSQQNRLYPNVVLPRNKYFTAKMLYAISRSLGPELPDFLEQEFQRWEEPNPS